MVGPGYREAFTTRGEIYDDAMAAVPGARDEEFGFVVGLAEPSAGLHLLDIPAGGGYLAGHLPPGVGYTAVECAPTFAARCRARGLMVIEDEIGASSLAAGCADVIVSVAGLHHEADLTAVVAGWRRLLRPEGRLVIADVAEGSAVAAFLDGYVGRHNDVGHHGRYLGPGIADLVRAAGFGAVRTVDRSYHWWFADERELGRFGVGLFGLGGVSPVEFVAAARELLGVDEAADGRIGLRWGLRAVTAGIPRGEPPRPVPPEPDTDGRGR
ncbi:MAG: class I SAM-dependent methyltransferase [Actinomycetota bacterium]